LKKIRGVTWNWNEAGLEHLTRDIEKQWKSTSGKAEDDKKLWTEKRHEATEDLSKPQMGFVAQEVERVFPDWVRTDPQGYKRVNMEHLNAVLVNAIKEQQVQIETEQAVQERQAAEILELKARLERLEQQTGTRSAGGQ
jgi:endosialidase-like protein